MTKAEAFVYNSDKWEFGFNRQEDHISMADTHVNVYFSKDGQYRLACYSSHGDSMLYRKVGETWAWVGQIEHTYDTTLAGLV